MKADISAGGAPPGSAECGLLERIFLEHPRALGESYWEHQHHALEIGISMIAGGLACLIHALVPVLFDTIGSKTIRRLYETLILTRGAGRTHVK